MKKNKLIWAGDTVLAFKGIDKRRPNEKATTGEKKFSSRYESLRDNFSKKARKSFAINSSVFGRVIMNLWFER